MPCVILNNCSGQRQHEHVVYKMIDICVKKHCGKEPVELAVSKNELSYQRAFFVHPVHHGTAHQEYQDIQNQKRNADVGALVDLLLSLPIASV